MKDRRHAWFSVALALSLGLASLGSSGQSAPKVECPGLAAAREAIVDDREEPYFSLLRPHDMSAKTGAPIAGATPEARRAACRKRYQDGVAEFTGAEKDFLRAVVERLHPHLSTHYPRLAALPWSFLKVKDHIEGGLPHTRGGHIVLSVQILQNFDRLRRRSEAMAVQRAGLLFAHEQIHVFQRRNPRHFDPLYTGLWGFKRAPRIEGCPWIDDREVVNPDATDLGWAFPIREAGKVRWIWPRVLFQDAPRNPDQILKMPADFLMVGVDLKETKDGFRVKRDAGGTPVHENLLEIGEYVRTFSGSTYIYHPAEAAADLFDTVVAVDDLLQGRIPDPPSLAPIRRWFRDNLK